MIPKEHSTEPVAVTGGGSSLPLSTRFNRKQMVLFVAIFAVLGITALIASNALTPNNGDFEAETMTVEVL